MSSEIERKEFSFGWLALKLLGKSLYSNAWSAISELVANGFDAQAKNVYIYVNAVNKKDATIEVLDDGTGMGQQGMDIYVKVGFNRRETDLAKSENDSSVMGRKGIGKLAALYLSDSYYLLTKTTTESISWRMIYRENAEDENEHPYLEETDENISIAVQKIWNSIDTGTIIQMNKVNLSGLGDAAFDSLERKLSNIFATDAMDNRKIHLFVQEKTTDEIEFHEVAKQIAFKNMAFIDYEFAKNESETCEEVTKNSETIIKFPYARLNGSQYYNHNCQIETFDQIDNIQTVGEYEYTDLDGIIQTKPYILTGWIGLHGSIDNQTALLNDDRFSKNKFYNPIQLRLYVRNKLAVENFLNYINNTQAFVNYIEGEVHFDLLDDDDLPDIATSNRQSLAEHDGRVRLLVGIVSKIVTNLISKRTDLAKIIKESQDVLYTRQVSNAKKQFAKEVATEVSGFGNLSADEKSSLTAIVSNKLVGEVTPKSDYIIFISHSRKDKLISDFIYQLLKFKGANNTEFFYTSRDDTAEQYANVIALSEQIKENILKDNVLLLYITSKDYKASEFCMFEGGAGWATRSVGDYIVLSLTYEEIPKFITNGKSEFCIEKERTIPLDRDTYLFLLLVLNRMVDHLNSGRLSNAEQLIEKFEEVEIPSDFELEKEGKGIREYMNQDIVTQWDYYIGRAADKYLEVRYQEE